MKKLFFFLTIIGLANNLFSNQKDTNLKRNLFIVGEIGLIGDYSYNYLGSSYYNNSTWIHNALNQLRAGFGISAKYLRRESEIAVFLPKYTNLSKNNPAGESLFKYSQWNAGLLFSYGKTIFNKNDHNLSFGFSEYIQFQQSNIKPKFSSSFSESLSDLTAIIKLKFQYHTNKLPRFTFSGLIGNFGLNFSWSRIHNPLLPANAQYSNNIALPNILKPFPILNIKYRI